MNNQKDNYLFYESPFDALEKSIAFSGKPKKAIAMSVYPGRQPDTAKSLLSRSMSSENTDVHLSVENVLVIMKETRPDDFINYLCDEFNFERPIKKTSEKIKKNIQAEIQEINSRLKILIRQLPALEDDK